MKRVFFILFLYVTAVSAADIELHRVSVMVDDIKELREHCKKALQEEQQKNETLQKELNMALDALKSLRNQIKSEISSQKECIKSSSSDENSFPKLKTKEASTEKITVFKATPFRLKNDAKIYDSFENPKYLFTWEKGRSFTSNKKTDGWIKITGYFVNRVWQPASEDLWVHEEDVLQRESK